MLRHLKSQLATILLAAFVAHGQAAQNPRIYGGPDGLTGADCEGVMMRLDFIAIDAEVSDNYSRRRACSRTRAT
jgi:hypothetical protein